MKNFKDNAAPLHHLTRKAERIFNLKAGVERCFDSSICLILPLLHDEVHLTDRCQYGGERSSIGTGRLHDSNSVHHHRMGTFGCPPCFQIQCTFIGTTIHYSTHYEPLQWLSAQTDCVHGLLLCRSNIEANANADDLWLVHVHVCTCNTVTCRTKQEVVDSLSVTTLKILHICHTSAASDQTS